MDKFKNLRGQTPLVVNPDECWDCRHSPKAKGGPLTGQTLIELLVTIVIIAGLASMLILYTRTGMLVQNLTRTAEKAVFDIRRAQHYALALRELRGMTPCAYGVRLVRGERHYTIFADIADDCTRADGIMQPHEIVEEIRLEEGIVISSSNISHVAFRSPTADTIFQPSVDVPSITFAIDRPGATLTRTVTINRWGRVQVEPN